MSQILHLLGLGSGNESISWSNARQKIRELVKEMGCDILGLHCSYDGVALKIFVYGMTLESYCFFWSNG